jgi:hypothetical protein
MPDEAFDMLAVLVPWKSSPLSLYKRILMRKSGYVVSTGKRDETIYNFGIYMGQCEIAIVKTKRT